MLAAIRTIAGHEHLLWHLCAREVRVRYKQSLLGALWALFVPLSMMLTFAFVFGRVTGLSSSFNTGMPYPVFLYVGLLPWVFFAQATATATNSLVSNRSLVTKIYLPRELFPISAVLSCLFDFLIASIVLVGLIGYYEVFTPWDCRLGPMALWCIVAFGVQIIFTIGLALWLSMANLFFRDVKYLVTIGLQLMMFLTNVIYPLPAGDPIVHALLQLNPMTPIIATYRRTLIEGLAPDPAPLAAALLISILTLLSGAAAFRRWEYRFAEAI